MKNLKRILQVVPASILTATLASLPDAHAAAPAPGITVAWRDKPPYHYYENGIAQGFLLTRTQDIFRLAGIDARFVSEPQKRIWANFARGATNYCAISWYRLPEREAVAQFSEAIHTDPPQSVLAAPDAAARVRAHPTLAALMADPQMTLAVADGVSYGAPLDAMIARSGNHVMRRTVDTTSMMHMLEIGRASYTFADRDDWEFFRAREKALQTLVRIDFPDMPPGLTRHIACSRDVTAEMMERLNQAIATVVGKPRGTQDKQAKPRQGDAGTD